MIEKSKLKELEQSISDKKSELQEAKKKRSAATDPGEMVSLDKLISDLQNTINALERTKQAVTYMPPQLTDVQEIVSRLDRYLNAKKEKVQKVQVSIDQTQRKIREVTQLLSQATENGSTDEVVEHSKKLEDLRERLKYIERMKEDTEALQAFPEGAITKEWEMACEEKRKDVDILLHRIEVLAEEYRSACNDLDRMKDSLLEARRQMKRIADSNGAVFNIRPILTVGVDVKPLRISIADGNKPLHFVESEIMGVAL